MLLPVVASHDVREAWLALAAARLGAGDARGAAEALHQALSRHAFLPMLAPFAERIAYQSGASGWCGLTPDGAVLSGSSSAAIRRGNRGGRIHLTAHGRPLLGSPLVPSRLERIEGFVEAAEDGGLRGWAWYPFNPDRHPELELRDANGQAIRFRAEDETGAAGGGLLARRRAFDLPADRLSGLSPPVRVVAASGADLLGSPLPWGSQAPESSSLTILASSALRRRSAPASSRGRRGGRDTSHLPRSAGEVGAYRAPREGRGGRGEGMHSLAREVAVVIPVHGGGPIVRSCVGSVLATLPDFASVIVVDDGASDPDLARWLASLAARKRLTLVPLQTAAGFPAAANAGLALARQHGRDAVLLNSDTLVSGSWLADLRDVAHAAADIGTVTPLSNSGGILSYPSAERINPVPDLPRTRRFAALARAANGGRHVEILVGIGFCLYIRADCLRATGLLRTDLFAQGYGEENDFCLRARRLGWRNVVALGVYVAHVGGVSMGGAAADLRRRNSEILERLHPGYHALVADFLKADPLFEGRRALDRARWRARRRGGRTIAIVTHDQGGGVERAVAAEVERRTALGEDVILLRPGRLPDGTSAVLVEDSRGEPFPNLRFAIPGEMDLLVEFLREERARHLAIHHLLGHDPVMHDLPRRLGVSHSVHVHDYSWLCPRVILLGANGRYCGEPDLAGCASCIADAGSFMDDVSDTAALRARSARLLQTATSVVAPSRDAATRIARYFPSVAPEIRPHERNPPQSFTRPTALSLPLRVVVVGAIGPAKGYDVLLRLARDAAARDLPISFVVVGHSTGDAALMTTGRVFITGPFAEEEAQWLIRAQNAAMALVPSVVPETWCYALTQAWLAGLRVAAFDIGAQAERIRENGEGFLFPPGFPVRRINNALLAACGIFMQKGCDKESEWVEDA